MTTRRMRIPLVLALVVAIVAGAVGRAHAGGSFKGTFGDIRLKSRKALVSCIYNRAVSLFLITGVQVIRHGRHQRGATAGGNASDPSAPGAVFPIDVTNATASFLDGANSWAGVLVNGGGTLQITGYVRGKAIGTLTASLLPSPPTTGGPIQVSATFKAKCMIQ